MSVRLFRLDAELVRRSLARSRDTARAAIAAGQVTINGTLATKAATQVTVDADIVVRVEAGNVAYVSRGGHKLAGALRDFTHLGVKAHGKRCLDAGASTGGFTDVLLRSGAREVVAVDVGYGQLAWSLQSDPRVVVRDRTNLRTLTLADIGDPVDLVVGDLAFISLTLVLDSIIEVSRPGADLILMVKPQFEVGRERLGRGGVVRDLRHRAEAVQTVAAAGAARGWGARAVAQSQLPGPSGNIEYFLLFRKGASACTDEEIEAVVYGAGFPSTTNDHRRSADA